MRLGGELQNNSIGKQSIDSEFNVRSGSWSLRQGVPQVIAEEAVVKGGSWLLELSTPGPFFSPERFNDEHRMIAQTADEFVTAEVLPNIARMEEKDWALTKQMLRQCGELGLLGMDVPQSLGGCGLDMTSTMLITEQIARYASFATAFTGQTNLSILSILLFGTDAQKRKYIPGLIKGELIGAYALSESGAGSDPMASRARADQQTDGSYILNGEKMWISNGGLADIITVFAKLEGHLTSFIVERNFPGVSNGKAEDKLGLRGSYTTTIVLQDVRVPAENLLGEAGKGQYVAYNVLNFGRLRLGSMCVGKAINIIGEAARYAGIRKQFGKPIATFGAIQHKLGEMTSRLYAMESALFRTAGMFDRYVADHRLYDEDTSAMLVAGDAYATESSIIKVAGSEMIGFVTDENVQIHGAYGFVRDYPAERYYRDVRVYRIFEGTNEINRLLIPKLLLKRAQQGDLPLIETAKELREKLLSSSLSDQISVFSTAPGINDMWSLVVNMKKTVLVLMSLGMDVLKADIASEQEIVILIADNIIDTYLSESAVLRAAAAENMHLKNAQLHAGAAGVYLWEAAARIATRSELMIGTLLKGNECRSFLAGVRNLVKSAPIDAIVLRRELADATVQKGNYLFRN